MQFIITCVIIVQVKVIYLKVLIKTSILNNELIEEDLLECQGIMNDNIIKYYDGKTLVKLNLNDIITLTRTNQDQEIIFRFDLDNETIGKYYLKDINQNLEFKIKTKELTILNNQIKISYELDLQDEVFNFKLSYEVIE